MTAEQLRAALHRLTVHQRLEVLADVDLPRSVKLNGAATIASRVRQLGKLEEVERALLDWQEQREVE